MRIHSIASIALDGYVIGLTNLKEEEIKLKKKKENSQNKYSSEPDSQIGGLPAECQKLSKGEICRSLLKTCMGKLPSKLKGLIY